ncbi:DUF1127 domain-containing protein [Mesorhizobium sp. ORM8.1]
MRRDQTAVARHPAAKMALPAPADRAATLGQILRSGLLATARWVGRQLERRRSRLALLEMTDEQLKDIGLSRGAAYSEFKRHPWE